MLNKETLSPEEFENLSKTLGLSDVEIAVAAAFADEGFEPVDCRDIASAWRHMQQALLYVETDPLNAKDHLIEAGDILTFIFDDFEYDEDGIYNIQWRSQLTTEVQGWAKILLKRLYGEPTHE